MAINFDAAPNEKPAQNAEIPQGTYFGKIEAAEMKQGQNQEKPPYLNLRIKITDMETNTEMGTVWDIISESESSYVMYKAKRLAKACGLDLSGKVELPDLAKLVAGKEFKVDITTQEDKERNTKKNVVDIFSGDIYYPLEEATEARFVLEPETDEAAPAAEAATAEEVVY